MTLFHDRTFCSQLFLLIQKHNLINPGSRLLLAVSGGLDSMVMLDFLRRFAVSKYQSRMWVAHLDHGLRPESAQQASELGDWCLQQGLVFESQRLQLDLRQNNSAIEARARQLRYAYLQTVAEKHLCTHLITAHTASDQLETMLMHWVRGGISGLAGMHIQRSWGNAIGNAISLIRPFMACTRSEMSAYADFHNLPIWEDSSNQSPDFFRNRLRQNLIPTLLQENPQLEHLVVSQSQVLQAEQDWLQQQAQQALAHCLAEPVEPFGLLLPVFRTYPLALQRRVIREVLTLYLGRWQIFTQQHIDAIIGLSSGPGGKQLDLPAELQVQKRAAQLYFLRQR